LRSRETILAILVVVSSILVVGVSVVRASELTSAKMSTLELPIAITVVATLTLVCCAVATVRKQRLITTHETGTGNDIRSNPQTLNSAMPMMAQLTAPSGTGRMPYPNYCDRCGQRLA
jgi:heme/copper-type cytochrome/quinol oxidase subunit 2